MTVQGAIARLKAHLIAAYGLVSVLGRPEELHYPDTGIPPLGVRVQYGCGQVRISTMKGRAWMQHLDLPADYSWRADDNGAKVRALLDGHFRPARSAAVDAIRRGW